MKTILFNFFHPIALNISSSRAFSTLLASARMTSDFWHFRTLIIKGKKTSGCTLHWGCLCTAAPPLTVSIVLPLFDPSWNPALVFLQWLPFQRVPGLGKIRKFYLKFYMYGLYGDIIKQKIAQMVWDANRGFRTPGPVPFVICICSNIETNISWTCHISGCWISIFPRLFACNSN